VPETLLIQEAITGSEQINDPRDPLHALAEFYRALNTRDLALMEANWDNGNDSAMDNPLGGIKRGWPEIRAVYDTLFHTDGEFHFEFFDYTLHRFQEIFYVVGRERGYLRTRGNKLEMRIRTTRVFRFNGRRWRQVHHHGSVDDPQLLKTYQTAVLSGANPRS
jgi:ketosteroid isomerase-like protein